MSYANDKFIALVIGNQSNSSVYHLIVNVYPLSIIMYIIAEMKMLVFELTV